MCTVRISSALVHPRICSWTHVSSERYEGHSCVASCAAVPQESLSRSLPANSDFIALGSDLAVTWSALRADLGRLPVLD